MSGASEAMAIPAMSHAGSVFEIRKSTDASPAEGSVLRPMWRPRPGAYGRFIKHARAMEDIMSSHPNVAVIERMTQAITENDRETLTQIFTDDMVFHGRGPIPFAGDHNGVDGLLAALGTVFELTDGDVKLEQLFCLADDEWGAEWERAVFGRNGRTLEMNDSFVYQFDNGRIREMWFIAAGPAEAASFWA